jgi:hypothetical protein
MAAGVIQVEDFRFDVFSPSGGPLTLRLTHLPTGRQWLTQDRAGEERRKAQQELFDNAASDLVAAGWRLEELPEEPGQPDQQESGKAR